MGLAGLSGGDPSVCSLLPGSPRDGPSSHWALGSGWSPWSDLCTSSGPCGGAVRTAGGAPMFTDLVPTRSQGRCSVTGASALGTACVSWPARASVPSSSPAGRWPPCPRSPWRCRCKAALPALGWGVPGQAPGVQDLTGTPASHPLHPALSQSAWKTHMSSTSTRSGWESSPKALTKSS